MSNPNTTTVADALRLKAEAETRIAETITAEIAKLRDATGICPDSITVETMSLLRVGDPYRLIVTEVKIEMKL